MVDRGEEAALSGDEEPRLDLVLEGIWRLLRQGAGDRRHGFHLPSLATVRPNGAPAVRTLALRAVETAGRRLWFHTDVRSRKLGEIPVEPRVALLFYDMAESTQLRADCVGVVHRHGRVADREWSRLKLFERRGYLSEGPPGLPWGHAASGLPPDLERRRPRREESERGRINFAVIECRIQSLDWLYLSDAGHRRAGFRWDETGRLRSNWLLP